MYSLVYERLSQEAGGIEGGYREVVCEDGSPKAALDLERELIGMVRRTALPSLEGRVLQVVDTRERLRRVRFISEDEVGRCGICVDAR